MNILEGHRKLFYGDGGKRLSKNIGHHGWSETKKKTTHTHTHTHTHWLKYPKAVPKNEIWTKI